MADQELVIHNVIDEDDEELSVQAAGSPEPQHREGQRPTEHNSVRDVATTSAGGMGNASSTSSRQKQDQNNGTLIGEHHIVLRISEPNAKYSETRGTAIFHEVLSESCQGKDGTPKSETSSEDRLGDLQAGEIFDCAFENVRDEYPFASEDDILLIECTPEVYKQKLVNEGPTHAFSGQEAAYGVVDKLEEAIAYYYSVWVKRVPSNPKERKAWVEDIEEKFCAWQLTEVAQYQSNESLENLRLAIQFVKKWMAAPEAGVTEQMIPGHLKLIQKGWNELKEAKMPTTKEIEEMSAVEASFVEEQELPHPRECFQTVPAEKAARYEFLKKINENYNIWKNTRVARQFRKNILLAFEKLAQHSEEWLGYTDTDKTITESTLKMFFGLLKERWSEFMDKTDKYSPIFKRPRDDDDDDDIGGENTRKRPRTASGETLNSDGAVVSLTDDAKPAPKATGKVPVSELKLALDDTDLSQVSLPFPKVLDPNPLKADATKGLFGAVEQDSLGQVQHFFTQGATARGRDEFDETPLHRAAAVGSKNILEHLRLWGADPWQCNSAKELPVHIACWYGHADAANFLLKQLGKTDLSSLVDFRGRTPLHLASQQGHFSVVRLLVDMFGQDVIHLRDDDNLLPRHYAVMGGHAELVQFLDGLGADRSDDGAFNPNSLHDACSTGRLGLVQWIVESTYANLEDKDSSGRTPLECARGSGHTQIVDWIEECLRVGPHSETA